MFHIFEKKFPNIEAEETYFYDALDNYCHDTGDAIDKFFTINYLMLLKQYIEEQCSKKEKNTLKLISILSSSLPSQDKTVTTVDLMFNSLLSSAPTSFLPVKYTLIKPNITVDNLYNIFLFFKFNLLNTIKEESCDEDVKLVQSRYQKEMSLLDKSIEQAEAYEEDEIRRQKEAESKENENQDNFQEELEKFLSDYKPHIIKAYLDKRIIGQEEAKRTMSIAIYNHIYKIAHPELKLNKNNVLMIGPSGCGKTEIMRVLSEIIPVPVSFFDTSGVSQNGWKGDKKIKDAVKELAIKTGNTALAQYGIIFLDEFDKLCKPCFTSHNENVSVHIQGETLAMIEGCDVSVSMGSTDDSMYEKPTLINTKNILFVCAGAFEGIEDTVKRMHNKEASIGFGGVSKKTGNNITAKDITKEVIMEFGVIPELAGRISVVTVLNKLTREDMFNILTKCDDNVLDELKLLVKGAYGAELEISEKALQKLIEQLCIDVGARGIRSILFEHFTDILFEVAEKQNIAKIIINDDLTAKYIKKRKK